MIAGSLATRITKMGHQQTVPHSYVELFAARMFNPQTQRIAS